MENCQICGSTNWLLLPDPNKNQSVTTTGRIVNRPLGKSQCVKCGFVQRTRENFLGLSDYYEQDYANYYNRPGTEEFHKNRYSTIVDWMCQFIVPEFTFKTVLDVGCGQGWAMEAFLNKYPEIKITGIEPSTYNVDIARSKGLEVKTGKLEQMQSDVKFDLIFSNNVIQHVNDAKAFLFDLKDKLSDNGIIIVTCPDGSKPNIELLWADQNYSFLPIHLLNLGEDLGFEIFNLAQSSESSSLPPSQLILLTNNLLFKNRFVNSKLSSFESIEKVFKQRVDYLESFEKIDEFLFTSVLNEKNVFNFGASYWTSVLAAYCPEYWNLVEACVIDRNNEYKDFLGKKIFDLNAIPPKSIIVLGITPSSHKLLKSFYKDNYKVICWDQFINY